jgi:hypothetical protein
MSNKHGPPASRWPVLPPNNFPHTPASALGRTPAALSPDSTPAPVQALPGKVLPDLHLPSGNPTVSSIPSGTTTQPMIAPPDARITLETFRCLLGIPQDSPPLPRSDRDRTNPSSITHRLFAPIRRHNHIPKWLRLQSCHPEAATSTYFAILGEESGTWREYYFYDAFVYTSMIIQLCISSALVILGALRKTSTSPLRFWEPSTAFSRESSR